MEFTVCVVWKWKEKSMHSHALKNARRSGLGRDRRQVFFPFITQKVCCCQEPDGDNLADLIFVMV